MAFVRGWRRCSDASVRGLPAWESEEVLILYAFLGKGVGVLFLFHQSHVSPSGIRWSRFMGGRFGDSVVLGNLLTDAYKVISFVTTATSLAWSWAYVTVVVPLGATEKAKSVGVGFRSWSARRFFDQFVRRRGSGRCGGISQKLLCMLCHLKRYNLIHHESRYERGILQFPLAISVKYVFLEAIEGFVETEEKLTPNKFFCLHAKRPSPHGNMYSVSYVEMEVWSACDIFAQEW